MNWARNGRMAGRLAVVAAAVLTASPALADFHLWQLKEVFSNQDGTAQFIELFTTFSGQNNLSPGHALTATSDGVPQVFSIPTDLGNSTANRHMILATAGFGSLIGGITPDYSLPEHFFNPNATNLSFNFAGVDSFTFTGATLPKDGINSLTDQLLIGSSTNLVAGVNSPNNSSQQSGSVSLAAAPTFDGDFNVNGMVDRFDLASWRLGFGLATGATHIQGDADGDHDVDGDDFLVWQRRLGSPGQAASANAPVPEPATLLLVAVAAAAIRRMSVRKRQEVINA